MAEYYIQFATTIDLTEEEYNWFEEQLQVVNVYNGEAYLPEEVPPKLCRHAPDWSGYRLLAKHRYDLRQEIGFQRTVNKDAQQYWVRIYDMEHGEPFAVGLVMREFLAKFRPHERWFMEYSRSCSKPRNDAFGGGVVLVTADSIKMVDSYDLGANFAIGKKAIELEPEPEVAVDPSTNEEKTG